MKKIKYFWENNKAKDIIIIMIVILVGISSFYLGRLSYQDSQKGLKIEYKSQEASILGSFEANSSNISPNPSITEKVNNQALGKYFASKIGRKYYPIGCSAGKSIKQENRIYFSSVNEAEKAGYEISASCR